MLPRPDLLTFHFPSDASSTLPAQACCDVMCVERKTYRTTISHLLCCVLHHAALVMTGNMMCVIMQSSLVILLQFMHLLLSAKLFFAFENLWSIKDHVVLCPRRVVLVTASWPNFMNVASLSTPCIIVGRGCCSTLHALK